VIWLEPPKFIMGHMTWPRPYQGRFVVCRPFAVTCKFNLCIKFEVSLFAITHYEDAWGNAKCRNWAGKCLGVTQGHRQHNHSIERIRFIYGSLESARGQLPISAIWTFFASCYGWTAMSGYWSKSLCSKGVGHFERKFQREGWSSTNDSWRQKTRVPGLSRHVALYAWSYLRLAVLIQYRCVTDRQTDTQTHDNG